MNEQDLISELTYASYAHNRELGMTAEQLYKIGFSLKYEVKYQFEKDQPQKTKIIELKPTIERN